MNTPRDDEAQADALRAWQERQDSGEANCLETIVSLALIVLLITASVVGHSIVSANVPF